jgi:hypothetical protein
MELFHQSDWLSVVCHKALFLGHYYFYYILVTCLKTKSRLFAAGESINDVEAAINSDLENFRKWLIANQLSLNVAIYVNWI